MKVFINGQSYDDWSQLPDDLKKQLSATLPDQDHNGVPDVFEGVVPTGGQSFVSTSIDVNGHQYNSVAELPEEVRQTLAAVFGGAFGAAQAPPGSTIPGAQWPVGPGASNPADSTGAPAPGTPPAAPPTGVPGVPAADQIMLNGRPVVVEQSTQSEPKKGFFKRLFGR